MSRYLLFYTLRCEGSRVRKKDAPLHCGNRLMLHTGYDARDHHLGPLATGDHFQERLISESPPWKTRPAFAPPEHEARTSVQPWRLTQCHWHAALATPFGVWDIAVVVGNINVGTARHQQFMAVEHLP